MAEDRRIEESEDEPRRSAGRDSMRRRSTSDSRTRGKKRAAPAKFNGIHRRRTKRVTW